MDRQRVIEKLTDIEFKIGDQVYRIIRELGRGGNGVAFLCQNAKNQKVVAKVYLPPDKRDLDEKALERFENEVALTARLKHPNIVPSLGSGAVTMGTYRLPYYMMPQAAGTLRNEIRNDTDPVQIEKKLRMLPLLTPAKRLSLLTGWIEKGSSYSWYYEDQMRFVAEAETDPETRIELLEKMRSNIVAHSGSFKKRDQFLSRVEKLLKEARQPKK